MARVVSDLEIVRELIAAEVGGERRLHEVLGDLSGTEHESLARFLEIKEVEDRARVAYLDRTRWHRQLSWRLVRAVFFFGILSGALFAIFGNDGTIDAAIWFIGGGAGFYLCAQIVMLGRARADERGFEAALDRARSELAELATALEP